MATTKHGLANGHEVRDRVVAIAYKLYVSVNLDVAYRWVRGRTSWRLFAINACSLSMPILQVGARPYGSLRVVQLDTSRKATLREQSQLGYDKLVKLSKKR